MFRNGRSLSCRWGVVGRKLWREESVPQVFGPEMGEIAQRLR
jgi:hypothetical protein